MDTDRIGSGYGVADGRRPSAASTYNKGRIVGGKGNISNCAHYTPAQGFVQRSIGRVGVRGSTVAVHQNSIESSGISDFIEQNSVDSGLMSSFDIQ